MPVLCLYGQDDPIYNLWDALQIVDVMAYPNDAEKCAEFLNVELGSWMADTLEHCQQQDVTIPAFMFKLLVNAPSADEVISRAYESQYGGYVAGEILTLVD